MDGTGRALVERLFAARTGAAQDEVVELLADGVTYWDAHRGELAGREAVAEALVAPAGMELEALAADGDNAVAEVLARSTAGDGSYRRTEVYELAGGKLTACRTYLDPDEL